MRSERVHNPRTHVLLTNWEGCFVPGAQPTHRVISAQQPLCKDRPDSQRKKLGARSSLLSWRASIRVSACANIMATAAGLSPSSFTSQM